MNATANAMSGTGGPLAGLKVLDLTIAMAGPMCTQRMGEMGAEIIKIEAPGGGDFSRHAPMAGVTKFGDSTCFVTLNRNKKSLVLDLKSDDGRELLYYLVRQVDVLVQNFRPRVAGKLGISYDTLAEINPRLVYGSISGYGDFGPMQDRPGQDLLVQSFTGLTMNGGRIGDLPAPSPLYMVDVTASHMLCEGILAALLARGVTGRGQEVGVTMMGAIMEMQCQEITSYVEAESPPERGESPQVSIYQEPPYGVYVCDQDTYLAIAQADLKLMGDALDLPELGCLKSERPPQSDGKAVASWRDRIYRVLSELLKGATAEHWDSLLSDKGFWCSVVNDYGAFLKHPQAQPYVTMMTHPVGGKYTAVAPGIHFSDYTDPTLFTAPRYGADSRAVLSSFGVSESKIDRLIETDVVVVNSSSAGKSPHP